MPKSKRLYEARIPTTFHSSVAIRSAIDDIVQFGGQGVADTICTALAFYVASAYPAVAAKHGLTSANG